MIENKNTWVRIHAWQNFNWKLFEMFAYLLHFLCDLFLLSFQLINFIVEQIIWGMKTICLFTFCISLHPLSEKETKIILKTAPFLLCFKIVKIRWGVIVWDSTYVSSNLTLFVRNLKDSRFTIETNRWRTSLVFS